MASEAPLTEEQYFAANGEALGFNPPLSAGQKPYDFNLNFAQSRLQSGELMADLIAHLSQIAETYAGGRAHLLYYPMKPSDITVVVKPYNSVLNKIYRINYLENLEFPSQPSHWPFASAENLYEHPKINDLLRSRLICKYMDGPKFVAEGLRAFCDARGLEFRQYPKSSDRGYYAWHCYIRIPLELMFGGDVLEKQVWFELQLTTQLAEVISELTHGLYEGIRVSPSMAQDDEWRWRPRSQRFRSAYLGHTLHLLEGVIQTFRDEVLELDVRDPSAAGAPAADGEGHGDGEAAHEAVHSESPEPGEPE